MQKNQINQVNVTITCCYCNKDFIVPYEERDKKYCSKTCEKDESCCVICGKDFHHYGAKIVCSNSCGAEYMARQKIQENHSSKSETCLSCHKQFVHAWEKPRKFCSLKCFHAIENKIDMSKAQNCYLCGNPKAKNYDLIFLCKKCRSVTKTNELFWQLLLSSAVGGSKIVSKDWGAEIHIINHSKYCLKYLLFFEDCAFSNHYHEIKQETWHCLIGEFEIVLTKPSGEKEYLILKQGEKIEILPNVVHQIRSLKHSVLTEVSTQDFKEDSIRISPSMQFI